MSVHLWLVGERIEWTPLPAMFAATFQRVRVDGRIGVREVERRVLPALVEQIREGAVGGAIVARPYKTVLPDACDELTPEAQRTGAVNILTAQDGRIIGDTTEPAGIELGLSANRLWPEEGGRVLILGAGSAAAATAVALSAVPAVTVVISSPEPDEAAALIERAGASSPLTAIPWSAKALLHELASTTLLVNCTLADLPDLPIDVHALRRGCTVAAMRVASAEPLLVTTAAARGHRVCDGRVLYLHTQMLAFSRCTGIDTSWDAAKAILDTALATAGREVIA